VRKAISPNSEKEYHRKQSEELNYLLTNHEQLLNLEARALTETEAQEIRRELDLNLPFKPVNYQDPHCFD
jgi:hypothetical protein